MARDRSTLSAPVHAGINTDHPDFKDHRADSMAFRGHGLPLSGSTPFIERVAARAKAWGATDVTPFTRDERTLLGVGVTPFLLHWPDGWRWMHVNLDASFYAPIHDPAFEAEDADVARALYVQRRLREREANAKRALDTAQERLLTYRLRAATVLPAEPDDHLLVAFARREGWTLNEDLLITRPGKFEGEPLYAPYLWEQATADEYAPDEENGDAGTDGLGPEEAAAQMLANESGHLVSLVHLDSHDHAVWNRLYPLVGAAVAVLLFEDEQGFVHSSLVLLNGTVV